jgi:hypothetical protein
MSTHKQLKAGLFTIAFIFSAGMGWAEDEVTRPESSHPEITVTASGQYLTTEEDIEAVTDVTAYCLQCHTEGEQSPEPAATPHAIGSAAASHPVDIPYPTSGSKYLSPEKLDSRVHLIKGNVTCLSCHAFEADSHRLVLPTSGGQLCQACHLI